MRMRVGFLPVVGLAASFVLAVAGGARAQSQGEALGLRGEPANVAIPADDTYGTSTISYVSLGNWQFEPVDSTITFDQVCCTPYTRHQTGDHGVLVHGAPEPAERLADRADPAPGVRYLGHRRGGGVPRHPAQPRHFHGDVLDVHRRGRDTRMHDGHNHRDASGDRQQRGGVLRLGSLLHRDRLRHPPRRGTCRLPPAGEPGPADRDVRRRSRGPCVPPVRRSARRRGHHGWLRGRELLPRLPADPRSDGGVPVHSARTPLSPNSAPTSRTRPTAGRVRLPLPGSGLDRQRSTCPRRERRRRRPSGRCVLPRFPPAKPPARTPVAGKARTLLDKAVGAFGGRAVLQSVKGLRMQSTGTRALRAGPDSTIEVSSDTLIVFPDRYRQALTTPAGVATTTVRGPRGYLRIGDVHTALDAAQFKALTEALGRNPVALLKSYCAGTLAATVAGLGEHEGKPVTRLALADGSEIAIDSATGFILRVRYGGVFLGKEGTYAIAYDAYRPTPGGLVYPHHAVATFDGEIAYTSRMEKMVGLLGQALMGVGMIAQGGARLRVAARCARRLRPRLRRVWSAGLALLTHVVPPSRRAVGAGADDDARGRRHDDRTGLLGPPGRTARHGLDVRRGGRDRSLAAALGLPSRRRRGQVHESGRHATAAGRRRAPSCASRSSSAAWSASRCRASSTTRPTCSCRCSSTRTARRRRSSARAFSASAVLFVVRAAGASRRAARASRRCASALPARWCWRRCCWCRC